MSPDSKDEYWLSDVVLELDAVCRKVEEKIDTDQKQRKICKKRIELEAQIAQETKLNEELKQQLAELSRRGDDLDKVCELIKTRLNIADSDKNKLENAREAFQLAKELTGIRLDFAYCAEHPNIAKGYIKNQSLRLLEPFELEVDSDALWEKLLTAFGVQGSEENRPPNK